MKKTAVSALAALLIVLSLVLYVNTSFNTVKVEPFFSGCFKVWGHGGYFKDHAINSLPGIRQAFDLGAAGVELDVRFDAKGGRYIVSHDYPYNLKDGRLLLLDDVFRESGNSGYFWLDFKNLKQMKKKEAKTAVTVLLAMLEEHHLADRVIVESRSGAKLSLFSDAGIHTSYWISVNRRKSGLAKRLRVFSIKVMFLYGGFSALSMDHRNYTPYVQQAFENLPLHLFTINGEDELLKYLQRENVKVILSDENYYSMDSCGGG